MCTESSDTRQRDTEGHGIVPLRFSLECPDQPRLVEQLLTALCGQTNSSPSTDICLMCCRQCSISVFTISPKLSSRRSADATLHLRSVESHIVHRRDMEVPAQVLKPVAHSTGVQKLLKVDLRAPLDDGSRALLDGERSLLAADHGADDVGVETLLGQVLLHIWVLAAHHVEVSACVRCKYEFVGVEV